MKFKKKKERKNNTMKLEWCGFDVSTENRMAVFLGILSLKKNHRLHL